MYFYCSDYDYAITKIGTHWLIVLTSAIILIITRQASISTIWASFSANTSINPLKILVLFISMTILSIFLDEVGFFKWIATKATHFLKGNQMKLFLGLYGLISILTIFTSNDIIILTFTPFICYYAKNTKINPIPYLVSEFVAANTWSMALIIGNPTNIYLASAFQIDFVQYLTKMILPTLGAALCSLLILVVLFYKKLKQEMLVYEEKNQKPNLFLLIVGLIHLFLTTILLATASYIGLEMWYIALGFSISLLIITSIYHLMQNQKMICIKMTLIRAPWNLIPFILSMFIIVLALNEQGITQNISQFLGKFDNVFAYGISGALFANLINNIPMSVLFSNLLQTTSMKSVYASIIAANVAAFITPIGALAGIMWMSLLKTYDVKFSFKKFMFYGCIIGIPTLLVSLSLLLI